MDALLVGVSLGFGAGLAPGPLLALVIRSTLQDGFAAGVRVAISPLVTDLPIVVLAVFMASSLNETVLAALGLAGGAFVIWRVWTPSAHPRPGPRQPPAPRHRDATSCAVH